MSQDELKHVGARCVTEPLGSLPLLGTEKNVILSRPERTKSYGKLLQCAQRLLWIYEAYGFDSKGYSLKPTVELWDRWSGAIGGIDPWVTVIKYLTHNFMVHWLDDKNVEVQKPPLPEMSACAVLRGKAHRWFRKFRTFDKEMGLSLTVSIKRSKGGLPRPSDEFHAANRNKTKSRLFIEPREEVKTDQVIRESFIGFCRRNHGWWEHIYDGKQNQFHHTLSGESLRFQIRRTVREVLAKLKVEIKKPYFPSTNSAFLSGRSKFGQLGRIRDLVIENELCLNLDSKSGTLDVEPFDEAWKKIHRRIEEAAYEGLYGDDPISTAHSDFIVDLVQLSEPLKTRIISKGPAYSYYLLKPFQKAIWSIMSKQKVFRLIGEPILNFNEALLDKVFKKVLEDDQFYVSGDYSDATNNLLSFASETAAAEVFSILRENQPGFDWSFYEVLFQKSLTGHSCPVEDERDSLKQILGNRYHQNNGQLMGSITSFPILCLINAAICRWAMEIGCGRVKDLHQLPLLINGDDCLFVTNEVGHQAWLDIGNAVGLKPTPGKYMKSRNFLEINSVMFQVVSPYNKIYYLDKEEEIRVTQTSFFKRIRHINLGLQHFCEKSVVSKDIDPDEDKANRKYSFYRLIKGPACIEEHKKFLPSKIENFVVHAQYRNWLKLLRDEVKEYPFLKNIPHFLPWHLGGWGFKPINSDLAPTRMEKSIARTVGPNDGLSLNPTTSFYLIWKYIHGLLRELPLVPSFATDYEAAIPYLTFSCLDPKVFENKCVLWDGSTGKDLSLFKRRSRFWSRSKKIKNLDYRHIDDYDPFMEKEEDALMPYIQLVGVGELPPPLDQGNPADG